MTKMTLRGVINFDPLEVSPGESEGFLQMMCEYWDGWKCGRWVVASVLMHSSQVSRCMPLRSSIFGAMLQEIRAVYRTVGRLDVI